MLQPLFEPFACKSLTTRNRFVMAPMTRYFSPAGVLPPEGVRYYQRRAAAQVGLIITEGVGINRPNSVAVDTVPLFHGAHRLAPWQQAVDAVHAAGGAIAPQLWHMGGSPDYNFPDAPHPPLESPSGLIGPGLPGGTPMTQGDIDAVISAFVQGAMQAQRMGFDAVEFHGAHGYLFDQFFWAETNRRQDRYGGKDIRARSRFAAEVIAAVRGAVGPDLALILRISQWKTSQYEARVVSSPAELEQWLAPLVDAGVDLLHCSERRFWEPAFADSDYNLAGWAKKLSGLPTITVGSVGLDRDLFSDFESGESVPNLRSFEELERRFARGDFDLVAVGRALLADADWLLKVRDDRWGDLLPYSTACAQVLQ